MPALKGSGLVRKPLSFPLPTAELNLAVTGLWTTLSRSKGRTSSVRTSSVLMWSKRGSDHLGCAPAGIRFDVNQCARPTHEYQDPLGNRPEPASLREYKRRVCPECRKQMRYDAPAAQVCRRSAVIGHWKR
jgi:hypothetical protein